MAQCTAWCLSQDEWTLLHLPSLVFCLSLSSVLAMSLSSSMVQLRASNYLDPSLVQYFYLLFMLWYLPKNAGGKDKLRLLSQEHYLAWIAKCKIIKL